MSTPETALGEARAIEAGARLSVPIRVGEVDDVIRLEMGHLESFCRMTAVQRVRAGELAAEAPVRAVIRPGRERERHSETPVVSCLESFVVELRDETGAAYCTQEFPRDVFAPFALARGQYHLGAMRVAPGRRPTVVYALHAEADFAAESLLVPRPPLVRVSLDRLRARAVRCGEPESELDWVTTFVAPEVLAGLAEMENLSRAGALEVTGQIEARAGFDPDENRFVRLLDRLTFSRSAVASGQAVVFTAAAWADVLADDDGTALRIPSSVHTHVHLSTAEGSGGATGGGEGILSAESEPIISIDDQIAHLTTFPDPLSAAVIISVYPDHRDVRLYGYSSDAKLREEPGYFVPAGVP